MSDDEDEFSKAALEAKKQAQEARETLAKALAADLAADPRNFDSSRLAPLGEEGLHIFAMSLRTMRPASAILGKSGPAGSAPASPGPLPSKAEGTELVQGWADKRTVERSFEMKAIIDGVIIGIGIITLTIVIVQFFPT